MNLAEKLESVPSLPGVYLYKDAKGKIIYVGKSKNLKNRVRQYFQSYDKQSAKTKELVKHIADLEFIVVDNEVEALVLESNLIKKYKPRYNIMLKDDKQYPHIKITKEKFPKAIITRKIQKDGASYYGPFLPSSMARKVLDVVNRTFQLRTCDIEIDGKLPRPCLEYHLKRCLAPCVADLCKPEEYQEAVKDAKMFLEGRNKELAEELERRMWEFAEAEKYELAAKYRDLRATVLKLAEQQKMATASDKDVDIFGYYHEGQRLALQLFTMREGKVIGRREFFWEDLDAENFNPSEFFSRILTQYYNTGYVPSEIYVPEDFEDRSLLEKFLAERRGRKVKIIVPKRGKNADMIDLVEQNAKIAFESRFRILKPGKVLEELQEILQLPALPERIESFDISNISGAENVAGIVVFENGKIARSETRRLIIKSVEGANDVASIREAVYRRYRRLLNENGKLPQLILIDGGKGQVNAAISALKELGLEISVVGVVKPPKHHNRISHLLTLEGAIEFDERLACFRLIQQIRDETHKVAVEYHRKRREMRDLTSELTAIPGVGEKRKVKLLRNFGSVERIAEASFEELRPFVGENTAQAIVEYFRQKKSLLED
ncbi:MAG: excinuclease ABC subunit UvrC [Acidobacteria bacterium]|nr:MAG: excinuclease ABC subunit UvrC [Acidobacteriota bacterium]